MSRLDALFETVGGIAAESEAGVVDGVLKKSLLSSVGLKLGGDSGDVGNCEVGSSFVYVLKVEDDDGGVPEEGLASEKLGANEESEFSREFFKMFISSWGRPVRDAPLE